MNFNNQNWTNRKFRANSIACFEKFVSNNGASPLAQMPEAFPNSIVYMDNAFENSKTEPTYNVWCSDNVISLANCWANANVCGTVSIPASCNDISNAFVNSNFDIIVIPHESMTDIVTYNSFVDANVNTLVTNVMPTSIKYMKDGSHVYSKPELVIGYFENQIIDKPGTVSYDPNYRSATFNFGNEDRTINFNMANRFSVNGYETKTAWPTELPTASVGYEYDNDAMIGFDVENDTRFNAHKWIKDMGNMSFRNEWYTDYYDSYIDGCENGIFPFLYFDGVDNMSHAFDPEYIRQLPDKIIGTPVLTPGLAYGTVDMSYIYANCKNLTGNPVAYNTYYANGMYDNCVNLTGTPVCHNRTRYADNMYRNCRNLTGNPVIGENTAVSYYMYDNCQNLTGQPVINMGMSSVDGGCEGMYRNCRNLTGYPVVPCTTGYMTINNMYRDCHNITGTPVLYDNYNSLAYAFMNCYNLERFGRTDTGKHMQYAFYNCTNAKGVITLDNRVNNMYCAFYGCTNADGVYLGNLANLENASAAFAYSYVPINNVSIDHFHSYAINLNDMNWMFAYTNYESNIGYIPSNVNYAYEAFRGLNIDTIYTSSAWLFGAYADWYNKVGILPNTVTNIYVNHTGVHLNINTNTTANKNATVYAQEIHNILGTSDTLRNVKITFNENINSTFSGNFRYAFGHNELNNVYVTVGTHMIGCNQTNKPRYSIEVNQNNAFFGVLLTDCRLRDNLYNSYMYPDVRTVFTNMTNNIIYSTIVRNSNQSITKSFALFNAKSMYNAYNNCRNMRCNPLIGDRVTVAGSVFDNCVNMEGTAVSHSTLINTSRMYAQCHNLTDFPSSYDKHGSGMPFDNINDAREMFLNCNNIHATNGTPQFSNATTLLGTFANCHNIHGKARVGWMVNTADWAFENCHNITEAEDYTDIMEHLNLTSAKSMFRDCENLIYANNIIGYKTTDISNCFRECHNLISPPKCPDSVTGADNAYTNCYNMIGSPVCGNNVTQASRMYNGCRSLTGNPACGNSVLNTMCMYEHCESLNGSPVCGSSVTRAGWMYMSCHNLTGNPVCGPSVTYAAGMYRECSNLTGSPVCPENVTNAQEMYTGCANLTGSPVFSQKLTDVKRMYNGCANLTGEIPDIPDTVTTMHDVFYGCANLTGPSKCGINTTVYDGAYCGTGVNTVTIGGKVTSMAWTYRNCKNITNVPSSFPSIIKSLAFCFADSGVTTAVWPDSDQRVEVMGMYAGAPVSNPFPPSTYNKWDSLFSSPAITEVKELPESLPSKMFNMYVNSSVTTEVYDPRITQEMMTVYDSDETCWWFSGCPLTAYNCNPSWNSMYKMYAGCTGTASPICSDNVIDMMETYMECINMTGNPVCGNNVVCMIGAYTNCSNLTGAPVFGPNVTECDYAYYGCSNINGTFVVSDKISSMEGTFEKCTSLNIEPIIGLNMRSANNLYADTHVYGNPAAVLPGNSNADMSVMSSTYKNCVYLTGSPVMPDFCVMDYCYYGCTNLTGGPTFGNGIGDASYAYYNCVNLTGNSVLNMSTAYTGDNVSFSHALCGCSNINNITLDMSGATTQRINSQHIENMLYGCDNLKSISFTNTYFFEDIIAILKTQVVNSPIECNVYVDKSCLDCAGDFFNGFKYSYPYTNVNYTFYDISRRPE